LRGGNSCRSPIEKFQGKGVIKERRKGDRSKGDFANDKIIVMAQKIKEGGKSVPDADFKCMNGILLWKKREERRLARRRKTEKSLKTIEVTPYYVKEEEEGR